MRQQLLGTLLVIECNISTSFPAPYSYIRGNTVHELGPCPLTKQYLISHISALLALLWYPAILRSFSAKNGWYSHFLPPFREIWENLLATLSNFSLILIVLNGIYIIQLYSFRYDMLLYIYTYCSIMIRSLSTQSVGDWRILLY